MDDPKEVGFWIVASGTAGTILWNILNYMRKPTFVRRSSYDELIELNDRMRAEMTQLRSEVVGLRSEILELKAEVRRLMVSVEFWRDQYQELKAKTERS
jgi:predicted nuclease with TOPRIM domain